VSGPARTWLRILIDYGALVAFAIAFAIAYQHDHKHAIIAATPVLMIGSVLAVGLGYLIERRIAPMPAIYGVFALVFGGLTLAFNDAAFLKMKPTFAYAAFAVALGIGLFFKRNPLRLLMGSSVNIPEAAWRVLTIRYLLFFVASAIANEVVWRTQSDGIWVTYKLVFFGIILVFSIAQTPFLMKHMENPEEKTPPVAEPPDPGF
jgi:intracellular septation protein